MKKSTRHNETVGGSWRGYLFVLGAATMWGTIGIFFSVLHYQYNLSASAIGFLRAGFAGLALLAVLTIFHRDFLRVSRSALGIFVLFGFFGIALFYVLNTEAVFLTNVATASVLLYTAPAFVTLFAARLWHEPITARKLIALLLAFGGCALVAKVYDPAELKLNVTGVVVGAAAGFTYALFTVFAKMSSGSVSPWTSVFYSLLFGTLFLLPLQFISIPGIDGENFLAISHVPGAWVWLLGLCLGPTLGSYALYNSALRKIPASNASVVATIEPVVAIIAGFVVFGQILAPMQILGAAIIIGAALLLSTERKPRAEELIARIDG